MAYPPILARLRQFFGSPYGDVARFSGHMSTCLAAGLPMEQSIRTSGRYIGSQTLQTAIGNAADSVANGNELSQAFSSSGRAWPRFFAPMIRIGETTGRLDETFANLEQQCHLLSGPHRAFQRAWLMPAAILLAGRMVQFAILLLSGAGGEALWVCLEVVTNVAAVAAFVYVAISEPFRPMTDQIRVSLPFIGSAERELAMNRFFSALSMAYAAAGQRVEGMVQLAAGTVVNSAIRTDLLKVAAEFQHGSSLASAFRIPIRLTDDERTAIAAGELAGTLEKSFAQIAREAGARFEFQMELGCRVAVWLTKILVAMAIASAIMRLL